MLERLAEDTFFERFDVDDNVGQFGHKSSQAQHAGKYRLHGRAKLLHDDTRVHHGFGQRHQLSRSRSSRIRGALSSMGGIEVTRRSNSSLDSRIFSNLACALT